MNGYVISLDTINNKVTIDIRDVEYIDFKKEYSRYWEDRSNGILKIGLKNNKYISYNAYEDTYNELAAKFIEYKNSNK